MRLQFSKWFVILGVAVLALPVAAQPAAPSIEDVVTGIKKADYEGDLPALDRLYGETEPFLAKKEIASRVRYWRGFAMWRKGINGFNDSIDAKVLERALKLAITEFEAALVEDPSFTDAKLANVSCQGYILYIHRTEMDLVKPSIPRLVQLTQECMKADPDNPRLAWIRGPQLWNTPPARGGGQDAAIALYEKGLELWRREQVHPKGPLEPTWGEPELYMSLAYSYQNRDQPDLRLAEGYAMRALKLVPYWHYLRDILLPSIRKSAGK